MSRLTGGSLSFNNKSIRDSWETPQDLFDVLYNEFKFDVDVACSEKNRKCSFGYHYDSLDKEWTGEPIGAKGRAWCNPPYSNVTPWVQKAIDETNYNPGSVVAMLLNHDASTGWYKLALEHASEIRIMTGKRVQFVPPDGVSVSSNSKGQCLIVFRKKQHSAQCNVWHWDWTADIERMKNEKEVTI